MRTVLFLFILSTLRMVHATGFSATYYVPDDFQTIQEALDYGQLYSGDTIIVRPGIYYENINFNGKPVTLKSEMGPFVTVIDGGYPVQPNIGSVVRFHTNEMYNSILDGFTLRNGSGTVDHINHHVGGGIFCYEAHPTIVNNVISNNSVKDFGGGMYLYKSCAKIEGNEILDNTGWAGGGIFSQESFPLIANNRFFGNTVPVAEGGAINCWKSPAIIDGNIFSKNYGGAAGAIDLINESDAIITNNIIYDNTAKHYGGGIRVQLASPIITNNTIVGNKTEYNTGGGIYIEAFSDVIISNTILWDNTSPGANEIYLHGPSHQPSTLTISHSVVKGGQSSVVVTDGGTLVWGKGMIDADPLFVDPDKGDFHLLYASPCLGSGWDAAPSLPGQDFEGDPRISLGAVDIGADEFYTHLYFVGDPKPGGSVELKFVDVPGTWPVSFWIAYDLAEPPVYTPYGWWYLAPPFHGPWSLAPIPSSGVEVIGGNLPLQPLAPCIHFQAIMGNPLQLTNLCTIRIE